MCICICACTYIVYICMYVSVYACMCAYVCLHVCLLLYIHKYIHTYTHIHTYPGADSTQGCPGTDRPVAVILAEAGGQRWECSAWARHFHFPTSPHFPIPTLNPKPQTPKP